MREKMKAMVKGSDLIETRNFAKTCLYVSILMMIVGIKEMLLFTAGFILFSIYLYLSIKYWKCPKCNVHFPTRHSKVDDTKQCPHCGYKL